MSTEPASLAAPAATTIRAKTAHGTATTAQGPRGLGRSVWWRHGLAVVALIWALFPIVFLISAAFNPSGTLNSAELIPKSFSMSNFDTLFNDPARPFTTWFKNSLLVAFIGAFGQVFIGACAAYAFSRMRFKGRRGGLLSLLLLQMFPALLTFVALYLMFAKIGDIIPALGLNTVLGLGLVYLGGAMGANVWLLKGYFDTVPRELDEAAKVDGASHARIFFTMILRLTMPILVTTFMISFIGLFSEFLLASIFLQDVSSQTVGVGLYSMSIGNEKNRLFGQFAAGALLCSIPVVALYLSVQKQIVGGLTTGSVK
ncbi:sugar ABC transporter permease [Humibacillus sp. DSM 29435]|uniref:sugar ABC transporter permease n=1 Tax=Humibacillus sp. DSM 29435 TaxID=1869167 RepID=UPI00087212EB|nr:ABC transporter permease subunit [Humibacillus sp. DSM 29435]OFE15850.1 sugar ABC transporter permease [Humibacillus sp. DSM 29435]